MLYISTGELCRIIGWSRADYSTVIRTLRPKLPFITPPRLGRGQQQRHYQIPEVLAFMSAAFRGFTDDQRRAIIDAGRTV